MYKLFVGVCCPAGKNVDVAWKFIDVKEWQKLKKMTSVLLSYPGFQSVSQNSWVLGTAAIGLKTKQATPDTRQWETPKIGI